MKKYKDIREKYEDLFATMDLSFDQCLFVLEEYTIENDNSLNINDSFQIKQIKHKKSEQKCSVQLGRCPKINFRFQKDLPFFRDIFFMQYLQNKQQKCFSILNFVGFSPINFLGSHSPIIVTEPTPNGSLHDFLKKKEDKLFQIGNGTCRRN